MVDNSSNNNLFVNEYDSLCRKVVPGYDLMYELCGLYLKTLLTNKAFILNVGCGTCQETLILSKYNINWQFCAFDPELEMIKLSKRKLLENGMENRVNLQHGTIDDIHSTQLFEAVTLCLVLARIYGNDQKIDFLKKINSKLVDNGYLIYFDLFNEEILTSDNLKKDVWVQHAIQNRLSNDFIHKALTFSQENLHFNTVKSSLDILDQSGFCEPLLIFSANSYQAYLLKKKPTL